MVNIKINALTPGFTKPEIILIRIRYPKKKFKIQSDNCYQTKLLYSRNIQKRGLRRKSKVCTLDTQIKQSG